MQYLLSTCIITVLFMVCSTESCFSPLTISPKTPVINGKQTFQTTNDYASASITIYWYFNNIIVFDVFDNMSGPPVVTNHSSSYDKHFDLKADNDPSGQVVMTFIVDLSPSINNVYLRVEDSDLCPPVTATTRATECDTSQEGVIADVTQTPCGLGCKATFSCRGGYEGFPVMAICQNDATWSESIVCEAVSCPLPQQVDCGCATNCLFTGSDLQFGESINTNCPVGCIGTSKAVCGANKLLSATNFCQPVVCNLKGSLPCESNCIGDCKYDNNLPSVQYNEFTDLTCPSECVGNAVARCQQEGMVVVESNCIRPKTWGGPCDPTCITVTVTVGLTISFSIVVYLRIYKTRFHCCRNTVSVDYEMS